MRPHGRYRLTGYGLTIDSDRAIPGTFPDPRPPDGPADIRVEALPPCSPLAEGEPVYRREGETLVFSMPGVARYRCSSAGVAIAPEADADPATVTDMLVATALPAVLWMRGDVVLHAAALVLRDGSALALAGPSGVGKSTVIHALVAAGATLLADDTIRLTQDGDLVRASGLAAGYHLTDVAGARGFRAVADRSLPREVPLRAVAFLTRTPDAPALTRLDPLDAFTRLLANQHRPAIPALLGRRAAALALLGHVAQHCEMYEWQRATPDIDARERALLASMGLREWGT